MVPKIGQPATPRKWSLVMTTSVVSDEQLGIFHRRTMDLSRRLREGTLPIEQVLAGMQDLIEGNFDKLPQSMRCLIDCDAQPYVPNGWKVEEHRKGGQIEFDPAKVELYLSNGQLGDKTIEGNKLRKELESKPVMNACVLDHLLANTNLIPESWKQDEQGRTRYIYFWGTIYRGGGGSLCVRYLCWGDGEWRWSYSWLGLQWDDRSPAAVSAS
ncbi:MAG: hypothetical protein UY82_C0009G0001 [Candidatus Uhrbacteria bacterium GW2011_GWC2_53_7]|uniref:Uncharacterized protein n=1 Tax=Candidatus Uhrbacteria bacterium GW2011_GWC2_53_7 TaxID=1618986 RepID=A0A0G1Y089_9BACT|nr:MAG: hypothetical protein UY82_C0009G0001 [Candidatus Uhrbacteria bacterium GW2011_GWC2_53_7]